MSTFVLKREYALQLPNNYVEIDRDEMEYVDGGGKVPRWAASATLDALLLATPVGVGTAPLKYLGKQAATALVKKFAPNIAGIAAWALRTALGAGINMSTSTITNLIISNAASFLSVGGIVAFVGDYADGNLDGWISW